MSGLAETKRSSPLFSFVLAEAHKRGKRAKIYRGTQADAAHLGIAFLIKNLEPGRASACFAEGVDVHRLRGMANEGTNGEIAEVPVIAAHETE